MKVNGKILGIVVLALLLMGGAYWLGSTVISAQVTTQTASQAAEPITRMASALDRMATAMEQMGAMSSGMMSGMMGSPMMMHGQTGGMGSMGQMSSMMQQMQGQMGQMMQSGQPMSNGMNSSPMPQPKTSTGQMTDELLTRITMGAAINVASTFMNPLSDPADVKGTLLFKVSLDTHSGDLLQYDLTKLAVLRNSDGIVITDGFTWVPTNETSHHREGLLKVSSIAQGKPVIDKNTAYIELELKSIGIPSRLFRWEAGFLGN